MKVKHLMEKWPIGQISVLKKLTFSSEEDLLKSNIIHIFLFYELVVTCALPKRKNYYT